MKSILITTHNRPRYLKVTLQAIMRCRLIERWRVVISPDGPQQCEIPRGFDLLLWDKQAGNFRHFMRSGDALMSISEGILLLDDDTLVKPDTLEYLETVPPGRDFYALTKTGDNRQDIIGETCTNRGNYMNSESWKKFSDWVLQEKHVGRPDPNGGVPMKKEHHAIDSIYHRYILDGFAKSCFPKVNYAIHFGVVGLNCQRTDLEEIMFKGDSDEWINNILMLHKTRADRSMWPSDFTYGI